MGEVSNEEVIDVLERAHDVILRYGWCQEFLETSDGRHCTLGAISAVTGARNQQGLTYPDVTPAGAAAANAVRDVIPADAMAKGAFAHIKTVTAWNDAEGRTVDDVLDVYRMAQKKLAGQ